MLLVDVPFTRDVGAGGVNWRITYLYSVDDHKASFLSCWRKAAWLRQETVSLRSQQIYGVAARAQRQTDRREYRSGAEQFAMG